jgi:predicted nucleic acid-binding Zn ribbon protein
VAASLVLRVVAPVTKHLAKGRCSVCGVPVERGSIYCMDHLQQTVNAYRDRSREATLPQPKPRG